MKKQQETKLSTTSGLKKSSRYKPSSSTAPDQPTPSATPIPPTPSSSQLPSTTTTPSIVPPKPYEYTPGQMGPPSSFAPLPQPVSVQEFVHPQPQQITKPTPPPVLTEELIKKQQVASGWIEDYIKRRALEEAFGGI